MTSTNILLIQGHPDTGISHLCHALAGAYAAGARAAGHTVRILEVADLAFPLLRTQEQWESGVLPPANACMARRIRLDSDQ